MTFSGMDLDAAERLAASLDRYVEQVERVRQKLVQRVTDLDWWGPDAQRFKSEELGKIVQYADQMSKSAAALSSTCRMNLVAQREISKG
jgi:hypothetical protein